MGLSCLTDPKATVVCDASTVINLNATGCAVAILKALPNPFVISEVALGELDEDTRSNRNDAKLVAEMQSLGLIKALPLDDGSSGHFERLVAGRTIDTLDDGEAATTLAPSQSRACQSSMSGKPTGFARSAIPIYSWAAPSIFWRTKP